MVRWVPQGWDLPMIYRLKNSKTIVDLRACARSHSITMFDVEGTGSVCWGEVVVPSCMLIGRFGSYFCCSISLLTSDLSVLTSPIAGSMTTVVTLIRDSTRSSRARRSFRTLPCTRASNSSRHNRSITGVCLTSHKVGANLRTFSNYRFS